MMSAEGDEPSGELEAIQSETAESEAGAATESPEHEMLEDDGRLKWYALHTYSSYETKVKQTIEHKATIEGLRDQIVRVVIPTEKVIEIKGGKKRTVDRNLMPGYVLVQMEPDEECFALVKEIKGVSSFVGDGHEPVELTKDEVLNLLNIMEEKAEKPKAKMIYSLGDQIKVIEGPFMNFVGSVEGIDEDKGKLKVMVSIFGRPTAVELDVLQVEPA